MESSETAANVLVVAHKTAATKPLDVPVPSEDVIAGEPVGDTDLGNRGTGRRTL